MKRSLDDRLSASTGRALNGFSAALPSQVQPPLVDPVWQQQQYAQQAFLEQQRREQVAYAARQQAESAAAAQRQAEATRSSSSSSSGNSGGSNSGGGSAGGGSGGDDGLPPWQSNGHDNRHFGAVVLEFSKDRYGRVITQAAVGINHYTHEVSNPNRKPNVSKDFQEGHVTGHLDGRLHTHGHMSAYPKKGDWPNVNKYLRWAGIIGSVIGQGPKK